LWHGADTAPAQGTTRQALRTVMVQVMTWNAQEVPRRRFAIWPPAWLPVLNNTPFANVHAAAGIGFNEK